MEQLEYLILIKRGTPVEGVYESFLSSHKSFKTRNFIAYHTNLLPEPIKNCNYCYILSLNGDRDYVDIVNLFEQYMLTVEKPKRHVSTKEIKETLSCKETICNSLDSEDTIYFDYQEIVRQDMSPSGYEFLSRMKGIPREMFFQVVEKDPFAMHKFEKVVLNKIHKIARNWCWEEKIHFNVTPLFLIENAHILDMWDAETIQKVMVEITEKNGDVISELKKTVRYLKQRKGFSFVVDDFGEGVNNIDVIVNSATLIDGVKVGANLFQNIIEETTNRNITKIEETGKLRIFVFKLCQGLSNMSNLSVYFEGIEKRQQIEYLKKLPFKRYFMQGFYIKKPLFFNDNTVKS